MRGERRGGEGGVEPVSSLLQRPCCCLPPVSVFPPVQPAAAASSEPRVSRTPRAGSWRFGPAAADGAEAKAVAEEEKTTLATNRFRGVTGRCLPLGVGAFEWRCQLSLGGLMDEIDLLSREKSLNNSL